MLIDSVRGVVKRAGLRVGAWSVVVVGGVTATLTADAGVIDFRVEHSTVAGSGGTFTTNDLLIDFTGRYLGSQVVVSLNAGTIHQETLGGAGFDVAVSAGVREMFPALEADTFFSNGGAGGRPSFGDPFIVGGPVNLAPDQSARLQTPTQLAAAWAVTPDTVIEDQTDFRTLRLSLSDDAEGSIQYFASAGGEFFYTLAGSGAGQAPTYEIRGGKVVPAAVVPEPAPEPEPKLDPEPEPEPETEPAAAPTPEPTMSPHPWWTAPTDDLFTQHRHDLSEYFRPYEHYSYSLPLVTDYRTRKATYAINPFMDGHGWTVRDPKFVSFDRMVAAPWLDGQYASAGQWDARLQAPEPGAAGLLLTAGLPLLRARRSRRPCLTGRTPPR